MIARRIVTLAGDPEREVELAAQLGRRSDVEVVLRCMDRVELLAAIRGGDLDAIVSVGAPVWLDPQCVEEAARSGVGLVAVVRDPSDAQRLRALGAMTLPGDATVENVLDGCSAPSEPALRTFSTQPSVPKGKVIAVWGPKGAPGRTTVAIELAAELAAIEPETLLVDADPYGGDILQLLGVIEELPTIVWAARMAAKEELDAARLATDLRRVSGNGPVLLPGLPRADLWPEIQEFSWRQLLAVARAAYIFTVCDVGFCLEPEHSSYASGGESRNKIARATVLEADRVVAVCRADAVGIKNFLWSFEELATLAATDDVLIVANRVSPGEQREVGEMIRRHVGKRPIAYVPDRPADVARAKRAGEPVRAVRASSDACSSMRVLAAALGGRVSARGLLTKLSGRG